MSELIKSQSTFSFLTPEICSFEEVLNAVRESCYEAFHVYLNFNKFHQIRNFSNVPTHIEWVVFHLSTYLGEWTSKRAYFYDDIDHIISKQDIQLEIQQGFINSPEEYFNYLGAEEEIDLYDMLDNLIYADLLQALSILRYHFYDEHSDETLFMPKGEVW